MTLLTKLTNCGAATLLVLAAASVGAQNQAAATTFRDVTAASGIDYETGFSTYFSYPFIDLMANSGAAAGDYDNDGDVDLFIVRGDIGPNLLYRNDGALRFTEVAATAGLAWTGPAGRNYRHAGPTFADMDGDGDLDLFLGGLGGDPSLIFRNDGDGTFTDVSVRSGVDIMRAEYSFSAAFGDYDLDGDLDLAVAHWGTDLGRGDPGDTEHLWRNDSDGERIRFTSVSVSAGISPSIMTLADPEDPFKDVRSPFRQRDWSFTPTFARIDEDLYPDLLFASDFNRSQVFLNNGDGTFRNATDTSVIIDDRGMGSAVGDFDADGDLDWFVTSVYSDVFADPSVHATDPFRGNRLYRNDRGRFADATDGAGVVDGGWGWAACAIDFTNDGDLDIFQTNGWTGPNEQEYGDYANDRSRAFENDGAGTFNDIAGRLGIDDREFGRGVVCADFDTDGDVDILLLHDAATLWENRTSGNSFLRVELRGTAPNTAAAGARITVRTGAGEGRRTLMREITIGSNYLSQNPPTQVFGLGAAVECAVEVEWPDGQRTQLTGVAAGQTLRIEQPAASP